MLTRLLLRQRFSKQQKLFTPGPLNVTSTVRQAMFTDYGSRDPLFLKKLDYIRTGILELAGCDPKLYTTILLQGSGTYAIEATLHTCVHKKNDKVLIVTNGSYGERQVEMLQRAGNNFVHLNLKDSESVNPQQVLQKLDEDKSITHLSLVHSETTSGLLNPIDFLQGYSRPIHMIVDAMSSFGAYHIDAQKNNIDFLVSSSNKCVQGTPGFAYVIARKQALAKYKGNAISLVLDLVDQDEIMNKTNQFRFTPPTHVLAAFEQALKEHKFEGGIDGRYKKYDKLQKLLALRMKEMGFKTYLDPKDQGVIITTYYEPVHPNYSFQDMYDFIAEENMVIYPGKKTKAPTFRIGSIGELEPEDMERLINRIKEYVSKRNIPVPIPYK